MKKLCVAAVFACALFLTVLSALCSLFSVYAFAQTPESIADDTGEAVEYSIETYGEPSEGLETLQNDETSAPLLLDELPKDIENADREELAAIINSLSGEGVERVKALLIAGAESMERGESSSWDRVADLVQKYAEAISLAVCAVALAVYTAVRVRGNQALRRDIATATNNAVETVEIAKQMSGESVSALEREAESVRAFEATLDKAVERIDALIKENREKSRECRALTDVIRRSSAADLLVADTVNELLQLSSIPQCKKDAIYQKLYKARTLIEGEISENEDTN